MQQNKGFVLFVAFLLLTAPTILIAKTDKNHATELDLVESNQLFDFNNNLKIYSQNNQKIADFIVAVADSKLKKEVGLMRRKKLPKNLGMLFVFDQPEVVGMWMKNTFIPLDMLFISSKEVVKIVSNTTPMSQKIISSDQPVDMVLEINAGLAKSLNIKVGSIISEIHP